MPVAIGKMGGVAVMIDNFAIPAATLRGLFDYDYRFDRLILHPRVPRAITEYVQKEPVRFGEKSIYVSCHNGGTNVKSVTVNGKALKVKSPDAVVLRYDELPKEAKIEIVTEGGWAADTPRSPAPGSNPAPTKVTGISRTELPASLKNPYAVLTALDKLLAQEPNVVESERGFVREAIGAVEAWRDRTAIEPQGFYRPMTVERRDSIMEVLREHCLEHVQRLRQTDVEVRQERGHKPETPGRTVPAGGKVASCRSQRSRLGQSTPRVRDQGPVHRPLSTAEPWQTCKKPTVSDHAVVVTIAVSYTVSVWHPDEGAER